MSPTCRAIGSNDPPSSSVALVSTTARSPKSASRSRPLTASGATLQHGTASLVLLRPAHVVRRVAGQPLGRLVHAVDRGMGDLARALVGVLGPPDRRHHVARRVAYECQRRRELLGLVDDATLRQHSERRLQRVARVGQVVGGIGAVEDPPRP